MAWTNFSVVAFGSLLMSVPVLLHLLMRQRPRHQSFPALRFLRRRQITNKRQLRVKNWLLMALRMAAVGLLAAVFARPSVDTLAMGDWLKAILLGVLAPLAIFAFVWSLARRSGKLMVGSSLVASLLLAGGAIMFGFRALASSGNDSLGDAQAPVAAVLVFDTSPRMGLRHANRTRLEEATSMSRELLKLLPVDSEVAVLDASGKGTFSVDLGTAANMIDSLRVSGLEFPLAELALRGVELVRDREDMRKEVYVLSDLSSQVWEDDSFSVMRERLKQNEDVSLFVLDVGVEKPQNVQLGQLNLSSESLATGQSLQIDTVVRGLNVDGPVSVEVLVEKPDPTRPVIADRELLLPEGVSRARDNLTLSDGAATPVSFTVSVPPGIHHGRVRVDVEDGLSVDNVRYFTVEVHPPRSVLLVTFDEANADYVKQAISPDDFEQQAQSPFDCHVVDSAKLGDRELADFAAIALLDPTPLTPAQQARLATFVSDGGGLAIFLGHNAGLVERFNQSMGDLLPGALKSHWRTPEGGVLFLSPRNLAHPVLKLFRGQEGVVGWDEAPIFRHWTFDELKPAANVVVEFSNSQPAIVESVLGEGRILVATTPFTDEWDYPGQPRSRVWNQLSATLPSFMLLNGIFPYLSDQVGEAWNHNAGQSVSVAAPPDIVERTWQLVTPRGDWQNIRAEEDRFVVSQTDAPGTWRLKPAVPNETGLGFSVNLSDETTNLARLEPDRLEKILGEDKFTLARGTDEINRGVGRARVGRELFPFLMLVVVGLLAMEHLLSNRFYTTGGAVSS